MHRTVLLFRHGKSDWNASYGRDHDRPLNTRGKRASRAMGNWLANTGPLPELVLCSTAIRARSTCDIARVQRQNFLQLTTKLFTVAGFLEFHGEKLFSLRRSSELRSLNEA